MSKRVKIAAVVVGVVAVLYFICSGGSAADNSSPEKLALDFMQHLKKGSVSDSYRLAACSEKYLREETQNPVAVKKWLSNYKLQLKGTKMKVVAFEYDNKKNTGSATVLVRGCKDVDGNLLSDESITVNMSRSLLTGKWEVDGIADEQQAGADDQKSENRTARKTESREPAAKASFGD